MNNPIDPAPFSKRFLAFLIDLCFVIVPTVLLYFLVTDTFLFNALGGKQARYEVNAFEADTHLYSGTYDANGNCTGASVQIYSDGKSDNQSKDGYQAYLEDCHYYYASFLPSDERAVATAADGTRYSLDDFMTHFDTKILKLPLLSNVSDLSDETALAQTSSPSYFRYQTLSEAGSQETMLTSLPVLTDKYQALVDSRDQTTLAELNSYFLSTTGGNLSGVYYDSLLDCSGTKSDTYLVRQTYAYNRNRQLSFDIWVDYSVLYTPLVLAFFFVIPLCLKGQTLGKKWTHLTVISKKDVPATYPVLLFHYLLLTLLLLLPMLPDFNLGLILTGVLLMLEGVLAAGSKDFLSLHDRISQSKVVLYEDTQAKALPSKEEKAAAQVSEILDLSNLNSVKDNVKTISSFDEFEAKDDADKDKQ